MNVLWLRPDKPENLSVGRHRIAAILSERGHDVTVRNTVPGDFLQVLREPADVVVGTTRLGALVAVWRRLLRGTPAIIDHIDPISQFRANRSRLLGPLVQLSESVAFRLADHVMVVYEEAIPRVERHARNYTKTSLGVDYDRFANPSPAAVDVAEKHLAEAGISSHRKRVVYVGGIEPIYNVEAAADAMRYLPNWDFLVIGDGSRRDVVEDHPSENVHYLGTVEHEYVPGYLDVSDVGICLCDDRHTLKILEYGAASVPAVNVEGDAEARFGDLIDYCTLDPEDVAATIKRADEREDLAEFQTFTESFSWESIADDYESVFEQVTK